MVNTKSRKLFRSFFFLILFWLHIGNVFVGGFQLKSFESLKHDLGSGPVEIVDEKTIKIPQFNYDGKGPAAWFIVGNNEKYTQPKDLEGSPIPDENGSCDKLKKYEKKDIMLTLPGDLKWSDMNFIAVYCFKAKVNFGYVHIVKPDNEEWVKGPEGKGAICPPYADSESKSSASELSKNGIGALLGVTGFVILNFLGISSN